MKSSTDIEKEESTGGQAVRASFWYIICNVVQKGIQFFTVPLFTRFMRADQYGQYSMYQSWMSLISILATLNLSAGVYNNALSRYENDRDRYTSSMLGLTTVSVALVFAFYLIKAEWWDKILGLPHFVILVMFADILFSAVLNFWNVRQRFEYNYKPLVAVTLSIAVINPILGLIGITMTEERGVARILSSAAVNIAFGLVLYLICISRGKRGFIKDYWKYALTFNIPLIPHYLSQMALAQSDRIMIENMFGKGEVAIYSVAYNIGLVMNIVINSVHASFVPWLYQHCKSKSHDDIRKTANILLASIALASLVPVISAPEVIYFIAPSEYAQAVWVIPPVAISSYVIFLNSYFVDIEFYYEQNEFIMISSMIAGVTNIILNFIFMRRFGFIAAGYTTLACYVLLSFANYYYMQIVIRKQNIASKIYNISIILAISFILCLTSAACMILYNLPLARYLLVLVVMLVLLINKSKLIAILKVLKEL